MAKAAVNFVVGVAERFAEGNHLKVCKSDNNA